MSEHLDQAVRGALAVYLDSAPDPATSWMPVDRAPTPRSTNHRHPRIAFVSIAAIALAALLIVGLVALTGRQDRTPTSPSGDLRWMVTDLPSGMTATSTDGPDPVDLLLPDSYTTGGVVYASPDAPFGPIILVNDTDRYLLPGDKPGVVNYTEFTLGGRRAALADGPNGERILYVEAGDRWVEVESRNLDDDALTAIGRSLTINAAGTPIVDPGSIPKNVERVAGNVADLTYLTGDTTVSSYTGPNNQFPMMTLFTTTNNELITPYFSLIGDVPQPVDINDDSGYVITRIRGTDNTAVVLWKHDGLQFALSGGGVDTPTLLNAARSVRPASRSEWDALPSQVEILEQLDSSNGTPTDDTQPPDTAAPDPTATTMVSTGTESTTPPPPIATDPATVIEESYAVEVSDISASATRFEGELTPGGPRWTSDISIVFDRVQFTNAAPSSNQAIYGFGGTEDPVQLGAVSADGIDFINAFATDPNASELRVTTTEGHRYTVPLYTNAAHPDDQLGVIAIAANTWLHAEVADADGTVLVQIEGSLGH